jgi:4-hydroxybenzoate polyprenyltransferase
MKRNLKRLAVGVAIVLAPAGALLSLAVLPLVGYVLIPAIVIWQIARHPSRKQEEQRQRQKEQARINQLITYHLVAHKLADTPANRARMLQGLAKPAARGSQR